MSTCSLLSYLVSLEQVAFATYSKTKHIQGYGVCVFFSLMVTTYHFSLWTPKVKVKVAYSIVCRHFELLVGVSEQHGAPGWVGWLSCHSEALLVVQRQPNILSVQRAA